MVQAGVGFDWRKEEGGVVEVGKEGKIARTDVFFLVFVGPDSRYMERAILKKNT